jgi:hypothetical protein
MGQEDGHLLSRPYSPNAVHGSVKFFLDDIQQQLGIQVSFSASELHPDQQVHLKGTEYTLQEVLLTIIEGHKLTLIERRDKILIVPIEAAAKYGIIPRFTISGFIKDTAGKEVLIGAYVFIPSLRVGTVTNNYGFYSLTVPAGDYMLVGAYAGYKADTSFLKLDGNKRTDILLHESGSLQQVEVSSSTKAVAPDHVHLSLTDINSRPVLLGENDVMRSLQNVAGVQSGIDGTSSVLVRGGDPGQNLNLLDGVPLYYIDHFFGVTSVFNTEAIKCVDFHKGAFPSRFGGRIASIIDVNTRDGDLERAGGQFTVGLVKSSLTLEAPIIKNKSSVLVSGRRTWLDALWLQDRKDIGLDFYDVNIKLNYILNKNNRLYASVYNGRDQIKLTYEGSSIRVRWGNTFAAAKWTSIINPKLFINTVFTYSIFRYELRDNLDIGDQGLVRDSSGYKGQSSIKEGALRFQAHWYPNVKHNVEAGAQYSNAYFTPTEIENGQSRNLGVNPAVDRFWSNELVLYGEDEIKLTDKWTLRAGLHWSNWFNARYNYSSIQPRIYFSYKPSTDHIFFGSLTRMAQFIHLISNNTYGLPTDFWLPSTVRIKPEESWMGSIGYSETIKGLSYNVEGYFKDVQGLTMYNVGRNMFDNTMKWENKLIQGRGWSYGTELTLQKDFGNFRTSFVYTLAWTWRKFDQLNQGKAFPYRYDRRHNLKISLLYQRSYRFDVGADWTFMSGEAFSLPDQIYSDLDENLQIASSNAYSTANYTYNYAAINNYRLPAIHRLDLAMNFRRKKKRMERTWSLGIYNAYGRKNVMFVSLSGDPSAGDLKLEGINLMSYVPYISYKIKF